MLYKEILIWVFKIVKKNFKTEVYTFKLEII